MNRIVECVPNFSEGRRPEVIDAIVRAMTAFPDVYLLGREMDADHNRAVVTIAGSPESIRNAAFHAVQAAAQHIDLTRHRGEHPRMGATDVLPFVPIRGVTIDECVEIAKRVRFSSGGFRYVKAMGVLLKDRNQAQVSMNLTDFEQTPMELAFETVRREAERFGVAVASSEIVGLVPQRALDQAAEFFLRVENFRAGMVLENRIDEVVSGPSPTSDSLHSFVERVASADPAPGGGSVSALSGALGAALGQMSIRITKNKRGYGQHADRYADALDRLAPYTATLLDLIDADIDAFNQVIAAHRLPKESANRDAAIQQALTRATEVPSKTAGCAAEALRILEEIRPIIHSNVASDLQVGLQMLRAALRGAISNMRVNLDGVKDMDVRLRYADMITGWEQAL